MTDQPAGPVVPPKDNQYNSRSRDVIGNKEDVASMAPNIASLIALARYIAENVAGIGLPMLSGVGNPNGVTAGAYGQKYQDTATGLLYVCVSNPAGNVWQVI